ncbi:hypothetical protein VTN77DRAFT_9103 [Rasamsonia byssochlamydoides]|uniref:uncharacterized protein n=1 Tax=Rasamsonia byssochlamydoides TaxID=89139 RepID=UPI003742A7F3
MSHPVPPSSSRAGPPSPSTPPVESLKANPSPPSSTAYNPQTPTSPPLMSVGAQSYASNFANSQTSPSQTTSQGQPLSSPPSSTPMSTQLSQPQTVSTINSFPTPASSVSGHLASATSADDLDGADKSSSGWARERHSGASMNATKDAMDLGQSEHRRSDHDRQWSGATNMEGRPIQDEDMMDVDHKADTSVNRGDPSLESLQQDIGTAFHLCKTSHTISGPDPSLDLVSLYGLGPIGRSVMRADPVTGEKINRLRKSYEGKLKGLGLSGRNKPVKHEPGTPGGLRQLTMWPEEEWQNQKVYGKEIKVADVDSALYKLQMRAMKMEPGTVPNHEYWEDVLGHEKPSKQAGDAGKKAAATAATPAGPRQPVQANGTTPAAEPGRSRPSRGKKRHYDDNSFVGYGEGYADDDDEGAFYSNGEDRGGKKKRKKDHMSKVSPPIPERSGTYGVGMYGIGAR